jgi:hypothetical protein
MTMLIASIRKNGFFIEEIWGKRVSSQGHGKRRNIMKEKRIVKKEKREPCLLYSRETRKLRFCTIAILAFFIFISSLFI